MKIASDRIKSLPTSIFSTMSRLAYEYNAVNLGQGFPDFNGPEWIIDQAIKAMKQGKNQYAPSPGIFSLKKNIASIQEEKYGMIWDPDTEMTITAGATEGLYSAFQSLFEPGDEVIVFEPFYDSYEADIILTGAVPKFVTLHMPDFYFDPDELKKEINSKTKAIVLNTPHNPTGKIFSDEELSLISGIAIENDLLVISDEVYEFLTYDNKPHKPIAAFQGMRERTITISSTGKTFGMTGWKIGFVMAKQEITESVRKVHQWTTFAVNTPGQHAMAYAFSRLNEYLPSFRESYQKKRDILYNELKGTEYNPFLPSGSYFMMVDIPVIFKDDIDAATRLVKEFGVATIPPSVFYSKSDEGSKMLRLCFAKTDSVLYDGIEKLKKVIT